MSVLILIILLGIIVFLFYKKKYKILGVIVLFCVSVAGIVFVRSEVICIPNSSYIELNSGDGQFKVKIPFEMQLKWGHGTTQIFYVKKEMEEIYDLVKVNYPTEYLSDSDIRIRTKDIYVTISLMEKHTFKNLYAASLEIITPMHGDDFPGSLISFPAYYIQRNEGDNEYYNDTDNSILEMNCTYRDIKDYYQYFSYVTWKEDVCTIKSNDSVVKMRISDNQVEILSVAPL